MKSLFALVAAAFSLAATPAFAAPNSNFVGPRVEATASLDDVTQYRDSKVNYGVGAGFDLGLGDRVTVGVEANADNFASYRDFGGAARLGYAATDNLLLFGSVGYAKLKDREGLRVGGGVEISSGLPFYTKLEYRYSDFEDGVGRHAGLVGIGLRF
jgi:outer membrane immunogenic protein